MTNYNLDDHQYIYVSEINGINLSFTVAEAEVIIAQYKQVFLDLLKNRLIDIDLIIKISDDNIFYHRIQISLSVVSGLINIFNICLSIYAPFL
jgi:hypothetical protein